MTLHPEKTLHRLILGNQRYVDGLGVVRNDQITVEKRIKLAHQGQNPIATILTCSDSRLPVEMIFDADIGDLFVVRNAGNMVSHSVLASMELAVLNFGVNLCIVLGHTQCGAVETAINYHQSRVSPTEHIKKMISSLLPFIQQQDAVEKSPDQRLAKVIHHNILSSVEKLTDGSTLIRSLVKNKKLFIIGGLYNIKTGVVSFGGTTPDDWTPKK